jgi:L-rhamnose-H+ transport protein
MSSGSKQGKPKKLLTGGTPQNRIQIGLSNSSFLMFLPLVLIAFASLFQGTFGLGMKHVKPLAWEAWWIIYAAVAMVAVPLLWALAAVPDLSGSIAASPPSAVWMAAMFGFLWGVGGILFGVSVTYVGISLTYGIVMGLAGSAGSILPLLTGAQPAPAQVQLAVAAGVAIMLAGVALVAWAGMLRDRLSAANTAGVRKGREFQVGLAVATVCGLLSALLNVGFADAAPVAESAVRHGAAVRNSSLAAWVVVLAGAFVMNLLYSLFLLFRNRSWASFRTRNSAGAYGWAVLTGVLWFAALGVYGQGAALMGSLGPVVGWPMLLGLALIVSNLWAIRAGEWQGAARPLGVMLAGAGTLIVACLVLGYANSLPQG